MSFTCCEEFYIAEHFVACNSSDWTLIIKMDGSKVQTRFQLFIFRLFISLLINDIRSNIHSHVPIYLSTAVNYRWSFKYSFLCIHLSTCNKSSIS